MSELAIEMAEVSKSFGQHHVLRELDLKVPVQSIFAFVGNNGEGKSTAIRLILGLLLPDRGQVHLFGRAMPHQRKEMISSIGCLVEAPSAYPNLTAREFLSISRILKSLPATEIDRVLELVNLQSDGARLIGKFSLGMKQRLALAHALMGQPKLLILDEPTNGLDPSGIQEIRELLCRLPLETGCTVFISSHQLDELDKMATHLALLQGGRLRLQASLETIRQQQHAVIQLRVDDQSAALHLLRAEGFQAHAHGVQGIHVNDVAQDAAWHVNALLVRAGIRLHESRNESLSLERWFHQQTQRGAA